MTAAGGFEHILPLTRLEELEVDDEGGFWGAFEELPAEVAAGSLQDRLGYLRERMEASAEPLL